MDRKNISNRRPLYQIIVDALKSQIQGGIFLPGDQIPTEQELSGEFRVSRITARNAVKELQNIGLVYRIQGKGTFVAESESETVDAGASLAGAESIVPIISVVLPIGRHAGHDTLSGIESCAWESGYHVTFHNSLFDPDHERQIIKQIYTSGNRGIIVYPCMGIANIDVYSRLLVEGYPFLFVDRKIDCVPAPVIRCDNYTGFYELTSYVISQGHRRIAFVGNHLEKIESERDRLSGYCRAHIDAKIPVQKEYIFSTEEHEHEMSEPSGPGRTGSGLAAIEAALESLLSLKDTPTCLMAVNDVTAFHLMRAMSRRGIDIPGELSATGFDDLEMSSHLPVPLTTVKQSFYEIGTTAALRLFDLIQGSKEVKSETFDAKLVVRQSVSNITQEQTAI